MNENDKTVEIRLYKPEDFETLNQWWSAADEPASPPDTIPDTTFILTYQSEPVLALSVLLTNCKGVAYLENFVGNPKFAGPARRHSASALVDYACNFAATLGFKYVLCLAYRDKLKTRYQELGMTQTLDGVATFARDLTHMRASKGLN